MELKVCSCSLMVSIHCFLHFQYCFDLVKFFSHGKKHGAVHPDPGRAPFFCRKKKYTQCITSHNFWMPSMISSSLLQHFSFSQKFCDIFFPSWAHQKIHPLLYLWEKSKSIFLSFFLSFNHKSSSNRIVVFALLCSVFKMTHQCEGIGMVR